MRKQSKALLMMLFVFCFGALLLPGVTLPDLLKKYGLKPVKKTNLGKSCMGSGNDWLYEYERFNVTMLKKKNGTFVFQAIEQTK